MACARTSDCGRMSQFCLNQTCSCAEVFGLTGPNCDVPSVASLGSVGFLVAALIVVLGITIFDFATLLLLIEGRAKIFKANLAGRMFFFSWIAMLLTVASLSLATVAPYHDLMVYVLAIDYLAVLCQMYGLCSLVVGFFRIATMKTITERSPLKEKSTYAIIVIVIVLGVLIFFVPFTTACYVIGSLFFGVTIIAAISPVVLFYRAMITKKHHSAMAIICGALAEGFLQNGSVFFLLTSEDSRSSLTRHDSRDDLGAPKEKPRLSKGLSRSSSLLEMRFTRTGSFVVADGIFNLLGGPGAAGMQLPATSSAMSVVQTMIDRQRKKAEFFSRSLVAGRNIFLSGLGLILFWILFAVFTFDVNVQNNAFTLTAVFWSCRGVCLALSCHFLQTFSSHVYRKAAKAKMDGKDQLTVAANAQDPQSPSVDDTAAPKPLASWVRASAEFMNQRPLSGAHKMSERSHSNRDLSREGSHTSLSAIGKRLVDEVTSASRAGASSSENRTAYSRDDSPQKPQQASSSLASASNSSTANKNLTDGLAKEANHARDDAKAVAWVDDNLDAD